MSTLVEALAQRTCLVTGANSGIGWAASLQLAEAGHRVILGCRDASRGAEAGERIRAQVPAAEQSVLGIDLSLHASIRAPAEQVWKLDVLVQNAAWFDVRARERTESAEGVETAWATNHLGPALLTGLLMPRLLESADAQQAARLPRHPRDELDDR
jgi:NAD(P)-dependent dehydrogenase (short-subunit alcohol dehydrogenase family)